LPKQLLPNQQAVPSVVLRKRLKVRKVTFNMTRRRRRRPIENDAYCHVTTRRAAAIIIPLNS